MFCIAVSWTLCHCKALSCDVYTLLYSPLLYSTLLYSTLLYFTLFYSTLLYSTLLYTTLLYSTLLSSTLLYSTTLYYETVVKWYCTVISYTAAHAKNKWQCSRSLIFVLLSMFAHCLNRLYIIQIKYNLCIAYLL